jgi:hypothetical protein
VVSFTPRPLYPRVKSPPVPIVWEAGWAPEPVWTTWRREHSSPYRDSTSRPVASRYTACAAVAPLSTNKYCFVKRRLLNFGISAYFWISTPEYKRNTPICYFRCKDWAFWPLQIPGLVELVSPSLQLFASFSSSFWVTRQLPRNSVNWYS